MYPSKALCVKNVSNINMPATIIWARSGPIAGMFDNCFGVMCEYFSKQCFTNDALIKLPCNIGSKMCLHPVASAAIVNAVPETAIRESFF